jgi:phosphohistidine phosphatase SixA
MAGLGRLQSDFGRFEVSHLANQDHFRRLAQRGAQGGRKVARVVADFALVDRGTFV